jgi:nucleotide-binding universal stress UspA family protein
MKKVIAALDNSLAAQPVLAIACALGELFPAEVEPVHVAADGDRIARSTADAAGLPLRTLDGSTGDALLEAAGADDVEAIAIGARNTPGGRRPLGGTALAVATSLAKPVVIVPPDASPPAALRRVLVPVEGISPSLTPRRIVALGHGADVEVVVLHVHEEASLPAFTDQPHYELDAWEREFLSRYCPWGIGSIRIETRVGRSDELVPLVAEQAEVDLIALGWGQALAEGRAPVVRSVLATGRTPVMLVPVDSPGSGSSSEALTISGVGVGAGPGGQEREE